MSENQDVNEGEITPVAPSTTDQSTEEIKEPTEEVATETEGTEVETAESNKGANQRIRELVSEKKQAEQRAKSLADRLAEVTNPVGFQGAKAPYQPQYEPGAEISPEQYQADVDSRANAIIDAKMELKIKQNDAVNRINNESLAVVRKYSQLDPDHADFNKELSEAVTEAVEARVLSNPYTASPQQIAEKMMKPYLGAVAKEVGKVTENITKQVSETALRPTSVRKTEKSANEKSIAELEAELGIVQA